MSLTQYILDAREQTRLQARERNTWLTRVRWYYIVVLAGVAIVTSTLTNDNVAQTRDLALRAAAIGLSVNVVLWALTKLKNQKISFYLTIAVLQVLLDITLAAGIIYYQGGLASRATILFAVPILGAGLLFGKMFAYITALLCGLAYGAALWFYHNFHTEAYELYTIVLPAVFYAVVFLIIAIIVSAYRTRTLAHEREQSYSEILALLRHQLHHPSGVIAAIIDMLQHGEHYVHWPPKDKVYLQQLKRENKKLHTMISNAIEAIANDDTELKKAKVFDIVPLLNDEATSCAIGAKRINDLKTMLPNTTVEVEGNPQQLTVALENVLENAFRYTEPGTEVSVSIKEKNLKVFVIIQDKGQGMTSEQQKMLFKLFSQMEDRISGKTEDTEQLYSMGLGLYVSRLIIERHHGTLELDSTPEQGTKITLTLYKRLG